MGGIPKAQLPGFEVGHTLRHVFHSRAPYRMSLTCSASFPFLTYFLHSLPRLSWEHSPNKPLVQRSLAQGSPSFPSSLTARRKVCLCHDFFPREKNHGPKMTCDLVRPAWSLEPFFQALGHPQTSETSPKTEAACSVPH